MDPRAGGGGKGSERQSAEQNQSGAKCLCGFSLICSEGGLGKGAWQKGLCWKPPPKKPVTEVLRKQTWRTPLPLPPGRPEASIAPSFRDHRALAGHRAGVGRAAFPQVKPLWSPLVTRWVWARSRLLRGEQEEMEVATSNNSHRDFWELGQPFRALSSLSMQYSSYNTGGGCGFVLKNIGKGRTTRKTEAQAMARNEEETRVAAKVRARESVLSVWFKK